MDTPSIPCLALTEEAAARAIGYTRRGMQNMRLRGGGPPYVKIGRFVRYRPEDLEAWLDSQVSLSSTSDETARAGKEAA